MVQCCRCNGSGLCKNCSCVKAGKACVDCLPSKRQRCSNTCHQPCPLSPIPSPPAAQPRSDTSPQRATPRHDALQLMQQQGTPTSQPQTVPAGSTDSISGPFQLVPTKISKLPEFNPLTGPAFVWGTVDSVSFTSMLDVAYKEVVHWRKNLFKIPQGKAGKSFANELSRLFNAFSTG